MIDLYQTYIISFRTFYSDIKKITILAKSSNQPLSFLSFIFKGINNLANVFASTDRQACQKTIPLNRLAEFSALQPGGIDE